MLPAATQLLSNKMGQQVEELHVGLQHIKALVVGTKRLFPHAGRVCVSFNDQAQPTAQQL